VANLSAKTASPEASQLPRTHSLPRRKTSNPTSASPQPSCPCASDRTSWSTPTAGSRRVPYRTHRACSRPQSDGDEAIRSEPDFGLPAFDRSMTPKPDVTTCAAYSGPSRMPRE
jgi:hypothetical protein